MTSVISFSNLQEAVMEAATTAIKEISGKQYIYGPSFSTICKYNT